MKLLLTGATGFLGRNFLLRTLRQNAYDEIILPVRSIDKLRAQFLGDGFESIPARVKPIEAAAHDWKLENIDVDHLVHCASTVVARSRREYFKVNVDGTINLLKRIRRASKVVVLSSQSAAGPCATGQWEKREGDENAPVTWYGESKLEMENRVKAEFADLPYVILRPSMIFGPRDSATLALFKMVRGRMHFKPGRKPKYFSYVSVNDVVEAIELVLAHPEWQSIDHKTFFVASRVPVSDEDILQSTAEVTNSWGVIIKVPEPILKMVTKAIDMVPALRNKIPILTKDRANEIWPDRWVISSQSLQKEVGWNPKDTLLSTLKETYEWYRRTGQIA
jgi:nucleoside-diphosphate-sugar epimerase